MCTIIKYNNGTHDIVIVHVTILLTHACMVRLQCSTALEKPLYILMRGFKTTNTLVYLPEATYINRLLNSKHDIMTILCAQTVKTERPKLMTNDLCNEGSRVCPGINTGFFLRGAKV